VFQLALHPRRLGDVPLKGRVRDDLHSKLTPGPNRTCYEPWFLLKRHRLIAVIGLAKGIVERQVSEMDADPDLINTASGVMDLQTGGTAPT
jgi:hypothetical protein